MKSVAVYCGARHGVRPVYTEAARALGRLLAERDLTLVYGGGHVGLMGELAESCLAAGGKVVGVIPDFMVQKELALTGLSELYIVDSMHERKAMMAERADAYIAMPGGFGTFEELFEVLTWRQIGLHAKPVGLLNMAGYYDPLREFIGKVEAEGFVHARDAAMVRWADTPADLLQQLQSAPADILHDWHRI